MGSASIVSAVTERRGELIAGRYRLVEPVGQGGMGRVWRGRDETLHREIAVKEILLPPGLDDRQREQMLARMKREARTAARLNHPGIITVHDVVEHHGAPVIVMEFITGQSLADQIRQQGRLSPRRVAEIGIAVLEALAVAHEAGIVHRDLKPDNILLTRGRVVLTDFGIASMADATTALTNTGTALGTPAYMAPEQLEGGPPMPACDLWSLGATLHTAVAGRAPFTATTLTALYVAILTQDPEPTPHAGVLAPALAALLTKDPDQRATLGQARQALTAATQTAPAHTQPEPVRHTPVAPNTRAPAHQLPTLTAQAIAPAVPGRPADPGSRGSRPESAPRSLPQRRVLLLAGLGTLAAAAIPTAFVLADDGAVADMADKVLTGHTRTITSVAFSPDGKTLATGSYGEKAVRLWDVATGRNTSTLTNEITSAAFSPDSKTLATSSTDNTVRLWDVATGRNTRTLTGHTGAVWSVVFSPSGKVLATSGSDDTADLRDVNYTARLWDAATGRNTRTLTGHTGGVWSVAFSPDGETLATRSDDETVRLWDAATGRDTAILASHTGRVEAMVFSPDSKTLATGTADETVWLWDVTTGRNTHTLAGLATGDASVAFSPDSKTVATRGLVDAFQLWDVATGRTTTTLKGHNNSVASVAFSPDGKTVATGSHDSTVRLWDAATGRTITTLTGHTAVVEPLAFSPSGKTLATGSGGSDSTVRLWTLP
ncbi:WD40 repeat domain-containing serine/threonine protein kinase [Streptomyces anulatus]|uniref:WD40 repeat domain-containing serine/threonine protein kinase n=1 Tax=Streptomyces anulatus TaxID=1892 RepID=UPI0036C284E0